MKIYKQLYFFALILLVTVAVTSCGSDDNEIPVVNNPILTAGVIPQNRIEVPKLQSGNLFVVHKTKEGNDSVMTYCLEYDPSKSHNRWVAFRFDEVTRKKNVTRSEEPFADDPDLPKMYNIGNGGFGVNYYPVNSSLTQKKLESGNFSRGHICASADRLYSSDANVQTFYMTNMSPQTNTFNAGIWLALEQKVQALGRNQAFSDTLYVTKGGTISDDKIWGYVARNVNDARVAIPKYYYMALLSVKNGSYNAIGFCIEHNLDYQYPSSETVKSGELKEHVVTIDELETITGIDFFHNLPDDIEQKVESTCNAADWWL